MKPPDILLYADYPTYLQDAYAARREHDKKFSQRFINQRMGERSSGWFADIVAGRKKLKPSQAGPLAAVFKLEPRERDFLRALIDLERADSLEEKVAAHDKWLELKGVSREAVNKDRFKYFERWYYPVLREFLALYPFHGNHEELAAQFISPLRPAQVKQALALLARLGMIRPNHTPTQTVLFMDTSSKTPQWNKILEAYIRLSLYALGKFGKEERNFSTLTLPLSKESYQKANEEITALRSRLLALSERDAANDRVYQCLFQVFPVTQSVEESHA